MTSFNSGALLVLLILYWPSHGLVRDFLTLPQLQNDYVVVDYKDIPLAFSNFSYKGHSYTGRSYVAYVAVLPAGMRTNFSFLLPNGSCGKLSKTSDTASNYKCKYATNAGFFSQNDNHCVGNVIVGGIKKQFSGINRVNFGLTNSSYTIGYFTNSSLNGTKPLFNWTNLISGAGWLVRFGEMYINSSVKIEGINDAFVTEKAPRTGVCAAMNGTLIIVEVDGEEDKKEGLDLYEFSRVMIDLGCWHGVNLDGGGSSTSVYKGRVINRPTCIDTFFVCEREVNTITCIH